MAPTGVDSGGVRHTTWSPREPVSILWWAILGPTPDPTPEVT